MKASRTALFILESILFGVSAEAAELHGKVRENKIGGSPMVGVEIVASGANPTRTGTFGSFMLILPKQQPGDVVSLTIYPQGGLPSCQRHPARSDATAEPGRKAREGNAVVHERARDRGAPNVRHGDEGVLTCN
jgi:hypothetical protein